MSRESLPWEALAIKDNTYRMELSEVTESFDDGKYFTDGMSFRFGRK